MHFFVPIFRKHFINTTTSLTVHTIRLLAHHPSFSLAYRAMNLISSLYLHKSTRFLLFCRCFIRSYLSFWKWAPNEEYASCIHDSWNSFQRNYTKSLYVVVVKTIAYFFKQKINIPVYMQKMCKNWYEPYCYARAWYAVSTEQKEKEAQEESQSHDSRSCLSLALCIMYTNEG